MVGMFALCFVKMFVVAFSVVGVKFTSFLISVYNHTSYPDGACSWCVSSRCSLLHSVFAVLCRNDHLANVQCRRRVLLGIVDSA